MPEVVQEDTVDDRSATAAVLEAARALGPAFEAATRQAEVERTLPQSVVEQMREAGLFWLKTPKSLGGSELDPVGFCDVVEEIAYHDASAAWAVMIGNGVTGTFAGWLPDEGVEDLFPEGGPLPIMAGQFVPRGVAVAVPGGYRVTGRWSFSSGIMHSSWVAGAARVEGGEPGEEILLCVPKSSATVHDIWFVAGLEGTGSNDFSLEDVFVPASHTRRRADAPPQRGGPLFRQPQSLFVANEITPVAVGIARRALDDIVVLARATVRGATGVPLIDRAAFQKTLGRAEAKWLAGRGPGGLGPVRRGAAVRRRDRRDPPVASHLRRGDLHRAGRRGLPLRRRSGAGAEQPHAAPLSQPHRRDAARGQHGGELRARGDGDRGAVR